MSTITPWRSRIVGEGEEPPEQLLANPHNWRTHPAFQQEAVKGALDQIGWIQKVVVNRTTGHVIDGHLRAALAISRGEPTIPVTYVELTEQEELIALATFDPLGSLAVADDQLLQDLLKEVRPYVEDDYLTKLLSDLAAGDLIHLGGEPDLDELVREEQAPQPGITKEEGEHLDGVGSTITDQPPSELEKLRQRWGTAPGQVWVINSGSQPGGHHRLVIGDATDQSIVAAIGECQLLVTSPPYGMGQDYEQGFVETRPVPHRGKGDRGSRDRKGGRPTDDSLQAWRDLIWAFTERWAKAVPAMVINLADHTVAPLPGYGNHTYGDLVDACDNAGLPLVATRLWLKGPVWGNSGYWLTSYKPVPEYEYVGLFADLDRFPFKAVHTRVPQEEDWRFRSTWNIATVHSQQTDKGNHPAAYPLELPRRAILLFTDAGQTVVDPFIGSGTTMLAAEKLGRLCVGVERDPTFAAIALERMSRLGLAPRSEARSLKPGE